MTSNRYVLIPVSLLAMAASLSLVLLLAWALDWVCFCLIWNPYE